MYGPIGSNWFYNILPPRAIPHHPVVVDDGSFFLTASLLHIVSPSLSKSVYVRVFPCNVTTARRGLHISITRFPPTPANSAYYSSTLIFSTDSIPTSSIHPSIHQNINDRPGGMNPHSTILFTLLICTDTKDLPLALCDK